MDGSQERKRIKITMRLAILVIVTVPVLSAYFVISDACLLNETKKGV